MLYRKDFIAFQHVPNCCQKSKRKGSIGNYVCCADPGNKKVIEAQQEPHRNKSETADQEDSMYFVEIIWYGDISPFI